LRGIDEVERSGKLEQDVSVENFEDRIWWCGVNLRFIPGWWGSVVGAGGLF